MKGISKMRSKESSSRFSIIVWGYIKLVLVTMWLIHFSAMVMMLYPEGILPVVATVFIVAADLILHFIFIIVVTKRDVQFFRAYFLYSLTLLILTGLLGMIYVYITRHRCGHDGYLYGLLAYTAIFFLDLLYQSYAFRKKLAQSTESNQILRMITNDEEAQLALTNSTPIKVEHNEARFDLNKI